MPRGNPSRDVDSARASSGKADTPHRPIRRAAAHNRAPTLCSMCSLRPTCQAPCAAVEAILGPTELQAHQEIGSVDLMEGRGRFATIESALDADSSPPVIWPRLVVKYRRRLHAAVATLPPIQRRIVASYAHGESITQIAAQLGVSFAHVNQALRAALSSLRRLLVDSLRSATRARRTASLAFATKH